MRDWFWLFTYVIYHHSVDCSCKWSYVLPFNSTIWQCFCNFREMIYPEYNKPGINYCLLYLGMMWNVLFEVKFRIHVQIWLIVIIIGSVAVHVENQTFVYYNMYIENPRIISADGSKGSDFLGNHINKTVHDCFMWNVRIHVQNVCVQILISIDSQESFMLAITRVQCSVGQFNMIVTKLHGLHDTSLKQDCYHYAFIVLHLAYTQYTS